MKKSHIVIIILMALGIAFLVSSTGDVTNYATFSQASTSGKTVKVVGKLAKDKEIYYNPEKDPNYFSFFLIDEEGKERQVIRRKEKPQDFERSEQIVVTGKMDGETFLAKDILMKCPSKYKDEEVSLQRKEQRG